MVCYILCIQQVEVDTIRWLSVLQYFVSLLIDDRADLFGHASCICFHLRSITLCLRFQEKLTLWQMLAWLKVPYCEHEIPSKPDPSLLVCPHISMSAGMVCFNHELTAGKILQSYLLVFLLGDISALHSYPLPASVPAEFLCVRPSAVLSDPHTAHHIQSLLFFTAVLTPGHHPAGVVVSPMKSTFPCTQDGNWEFRQESLSLT